VAKSKRAPALFEVIEPRHLQGGSSRFPLPKWWRGSKTSSPSYAPAGRSEEKTADREKIIKLVPQFDRPSSQEKSSATASRSPVASSTQLQPSPPVTTAAARSEERSTGSGSERGSGVTGGRAPVVGVDRGRIQFSLNPLSLCVAFGVLLIAVIGAYQFGRENRGAQPRVDDMPAALTGGEGGAMVPDARGPSSPARARAELTKGDVSPPVLLPAASGSGKNVSAGQSNAGSASGRPPVTAPDAGSTSAGAAAIPTSVRVKGLNYLYIVRFRPEHLEDAVHAHKWLASKGIQTALDKSDDWLSLVSADGFDLSSADDKAKRLALEAKLKDLTPAYRQDCRAEQRFRYYAFDKPELRKQKD